MLSEHNGLVIQLLISVHQMLIPISSNNSDAQGWSMLLRREVPTGWPVYETDVACRWLVPAHWICTVLQQSGLLRRLLYRGVSLPYRRRSFPLANNRFIVEHVRCGHWQTEADRCCAMPYTWSVGRHFIRSQWRLGCCTTYGVHAIHTLLNWKWHAGWPR